MKKVIVKDLSGMETYSAQMEDPQPWIESCVAKNLWGLPERWMLHRSELGSRPYEDSDVILDEMRPDSDGSVHRWVKLRGQYTVEITDVTAQVAQQQINRDAEEYLTSTDWYIIREVDSGVSCPSDIRSLREQARQRIVR